MVMTGCSSCIDTKNRGGLFLSLPSDIPLTRRIWLEVRELFRPKRDELPAATEETDSRFGFLVTATELSLSARLLKEAQFALGRIAGAQRAWVKFESLKATAISRESSADLAFLSGINIAPFHAS